MDAAATAPTRLARSLGLAAAAIALAAQPLLATTVDLTSGTTGSLTGVPQSFNETRGIDVTVLANTNLHVTAMTLTGLGIGGASSAFVEVRIYNSGNGTIVAANDVTITSAGLPLTIPVAATLFVGAEYRVAFFVGTTPGSQGSATLFDPAPAGSGGFPYTETTGLLRINGAYEVATDSFPTNTNIFVPQIKLNLTVGNTNWTDLGNAKAGSSGTPALAGTGTLSDGSGNQLDLSHGAPSSTAALFFGLTQANAPFKGGVLVPSPQVMVVLGTDSGGLASLFFVFPSGVPAGTALYFQFWIQDAGASHGFAASNGLKGVTS